MEKDARFYQAYLSHRHISRRGLFRALLNAPKNSSPEPEGIPLPPGAVADAVFYARCTRCGQCEQACPMGLIVAGEEGYPRLIIDYASCDGCNRCIQACATEALTQQASFDTRLRPVIDSGRCSNPHRRCEQCLTYCPGGAFSMGDRAIPVLDPIRCNGCGECRVQCDAGAISLAVLPARHHL